MYAKSTVAFLDILGFKDIIAMSESNASVLSRVSAALSVLKRFETMEYEVAGSQPDAKYGQGFSDNVVIVGQPYWVLCEVSALTQSLLELGFATRGGIATGKIYCSDRITFGPALVRAVDIEKSVARVPRVVVDETCLRLIKTERPAPAVDLVRKDADGESFVDFLALSESLARTRGLSYLKCLSPLRMLVTDSLEAFKEKPELLRKYQWLAKYFNESIAMKELSWIKPVE